MGSKVLRVRMLGGFSMYYGGDPVVFNKMGSSKSVRLLQMLLLSLENGISKSELIDNLYGWNEKQDMANGNKNLNNLIYRLKKQLISSGLPDGEYVAINDGMCSFQCGVALELDTRLFEEAVEKAQKMYRGGVKRVQLFCRANELYTGELLPANLSDAWFYHKSNYYKELYLETIRELEQEYLRERNYKNRLLLYSRAAAIYPFENWQTSLIRCNLEMYRYKEALDIYNETMELYAREMGTPPMKEMQECFEELQLTDENHRMDSVDPGSWRKMDRAFMMRRKEIQKAIFQEEEKAGAYYCTYPSFVDYCRLVARAKERSTFPALLMFLTLSQKGKKESTKPMDLQKQMQILKSAIGNSLRTGDAYTRYGNRHFILMLVKTEKEYCSSIFQRIETDYIRKSGRGELWYYADMTQELSESVL